MDDYSKYGPHEILKMVNETKDDHDNLKLEINDLSIKRDELAKQVNELTDTINDKLALLDELEIKYVRLMEPLVSNNT